MAVGIRYSRLRVSSGISGGEPRLLDMVVEWYQDGSGNWNTEDDHNWRFTYPCTHLHRTRRAALACREK